MSPDQTREILALLQNQSDGLERRAARIVGTADTPNVVQDVVQDVVLRRWNPARNHVTDHRRFGLFAAMPPVADGLTAFHSSASAAA